MPHTDFWVSVNGTPISSMLEPILIAMTITDTDGEEADSLEIEVDDAGGQISLPPTDAPIQAGMVRVEDGGSDAGPPKMFSGKVDKVTSRMARGGGLTLLITAKSVDQKGKPKERQQSHHDKGKLSGVAQKFGQGAGLKVKVAPGIDVERDWWGMQGESFLEWGQRIAHEVGATFKVRGDQAVFAERSAGQSSGGQGLAAVRAHREFDTDGTRIGNIVSGELSPTEDRHAWQKFEARYYDPKDAKYKTQDFEARRRPGSVVHRDRFTRADQGSAKARTKSTSAEAEREQGGGTLTIDGDSTAQAEASCIVSGWRPGIDGTYRIKTARHRLTRSAGYLTELTLAQPGGEAGTDGRKGAGAES
ncbi:phage late control D family protein [Methylobacterium gregans]|uniref:Phage late control D family protein n=1 Tax=Methylobacterium gregans TaxID=374424 RepID=A0AA37MAV2_9HYPH|nr:hypothetical protein [Methylobacterium gregans]MDQ0521937.1 phage protein D [Methylobacterium gregans]GJD78029.1 hypothetical protein NBEOAGPD_1241 [Methylobacterium gregans]GLS51999.1 hypothetical protein GCM10007886_01810 [Methylobacterium gregans]